MLRELSRAARRWPRLTIGLWAFVGVAWAAGITADALNLPEHIFADCRTVALAATIGALNSLIVARLDRSNELLNRAYDVLTDLQDKRPDPALPLTPPPWQGLHSVGADDAPALRHGRGASQGSSGA